YDQNGETADHYVVERRVKKGEWEEIAKIYPGVDYKLGKETYYLDKDFLSGLHEYRMKAVSYKGTESIWSRIASANVPESGVEAVEMLAGIRAYVENGSLVIDADNAGQQPLYSSDGRLVSVITYPAGKSSHPLPPSGLYIFGRSKLKI
ncbi:MAG: hypothetical protein K2J63_08180, partial [Muribaculaceae bacterium]|nr:hypothetical protein [Muribaculaceae bacterium]